MQRQPPLQACVRCLRYQAQQWRDISLESLGRAAHVLTLLAQVARPPQSPASPTLPKLRSEWLLLDFDDPVCQGPSVILRQALCSGLPGLIDLDLLYAGRRQQESHLYSARSDRCCLTILGRA